jgi:hypothetical protein
MVYGLSLNASDWGRFLEEKDFYAVRLLGIKNDLGCDVIM